MIIKVNAYYDHIKSNELWNIYVVNWIKNEKSTKAIDIHNIIFLTIPSILL